MAEFIKVTEQSSNYRHLEKMPILELLQNINNEDRTVPDAVGKAIPQIEKLVAAVTDKMLSGGPFVLYRRGHQRQARYC
jgi:N-acetylmuramic acid 6-phosphate etherase